MNQAVLRVTAFSSRSHPPPFPAICPQTPGPHDRLRLFIRASSSSRTCLSTSTIHCTTRPSLGLACRRTMSITQWRSHAGHSHSHAHDNTYLVSSNKNDAGVRITRIGLVVNLGMAIAKGIGGWMFHSQALVADAFHSLTDLVSDIMTLATISWSLTPPTERFPTGYGKIESLGALGVSGILLFGGVGMGLQGIDALYLQFFVDAAPGEHVHGLFGGFGHSHSHGHSLPNLNAAWLAAGSIVVKEWLYRASKWSNLRIFQSLTYAAMKIAKERKSSVLASNAVHHRIDSLTSIVALLTIGGSHVIADASWLDPVGGIIISAMVIRAGWSNTMSSLLELADVSVEDEVKQSVRRSATKALADVSANSSNASGHAHAVEVKEVQGIKSGQNYLMDINLQVSSDLTVAQTAKIEQAVRERVGAKVRGVRQVRVKFTSAGRDENLLDDFIDANISPRGSPEPESDHDHDHGHSHSHSNGHANTHSHQHKKNT